MPWGFVPQPPWQDVVVPPDGGKPGEDCHTSERERYRRCPSAAPCRGLPLAGKARVGHRPVAMVSADEDAERLEEINRQLAAQTGDHEIVRNPVGRPVLERHRLALHG